jgi:hypothetical protein
VPGWSGRAPRRRVRQNYTTVSQRKSFELKKQHTLGATNHIDCNAAWLFGIVPKLSESSAEVNGTPHIVLKELDQMGPKPC